MQRPFDVFVAAWGHDFYFEGKLTVTTAQRLNGEYLWPNNCNHGNLLATKPVARFFCVATSGWILQQPLPSI